MVDPASFAGSRCGPLSGRPAGMRTARAVEVVSLSSEGSDDGKGDLIDEPSDEDQPVAVPRAAQVQASLTTYFQPPKKKAGRPKGVQNKKTVRTLILEMCTGSPSSFGKSPWLD